MATPLASAPQLALLSRTIFQSPEVLHIYPLQIRHSSFNDVALVGEYSVEIKEINPITGRLQHVTSRSNFGCKIRAAAVFGNAVLTENHDEPPQRNGTHVVQAENEPPWPPQGLIIVLESMQVVFLTLKRRPGSEQFDFQDTSLAIPVSPPSEGDQTLVATKAVDMAAVDPKSRAFATASRTGHIFFCGCSQQNATKGPSAAAADFRCLLKIDMFISKMDFLFPPLGKDNMVYLLLVGKDSRRTNMKLFTWDDRSSEPPVELNLSIPQTFFRSHDIPQLLIPLMRLPGAFLIACPYSVGIYADTHLGHPTQVYLKAADEFVAKAPMQAHAGISRDQPLWKAWCRPPRRINANPTRDEHLYLVREDGCLCLLTVERDYYTTHFVGILSSIIQVAFNHDGRALNAPDGVICCGCLSDGGTYQVSSLNRAADQQMFQTGTLYNWAPFLDLAVDPGSASTSTSTSTAEPAEATPYHGGRVDSLVGTSGREPYGALSQLRFGCEAVIDVQCNLFDLDMDREVTHPSQDAVEKLDNDLSEWTVGSPTTPTRVWGFELGHGGRAALVSSPSQSMLVAVNSDAHTSELSHQQCGNETLAARQVRNLTQNACDNVHMIVQVEAQDVRMISFDVQELSVELGTSVALPESIIVAAISPDCKIILAISKHNLAIASIAGSIEEGSVDLQGPDDVSPFKYTATCATIFRVASDTEQDLNGRQEQPEFGQYVAAIGTAEGQVLFFDVGDVTTPRSVAAMDLSTLSNIPGSVCNSIAASAYSQLHSIVLTCGLRSGSLVALEVTFAESSVSFRQCYCFMLGNSSVEVSIDNRASFGFLASCDETVMRIDFSLSLHAPAINYIWFTDPQNRSESIPVTSLSSPVQHNEEDDTHLVAISSGAVLFSSWESCPKPLPLRLPVLGTPNRVLYSLVHRCFFVASNTTYTHGATRYIASQIMAITKNARHYKKSRLLFTCLPGQSIRCLLEWIYHRDEKTYMSLVVATADKKRMDVEGGSIKLFRVGKDENQEVILQERKDFDEGAPVSAICQLDNETLLYCSGSKIKKKTIPLNGESSRTVELSLQHEADGAQHISAHGASVRITFVRGSVRVYHLVNDNLQLVASDDKQRLGLSHTPLTDHSLLLATDKQTSVIGLRLPADDHEGTMSPPLFEAKLPVSITRICRANVRPPWKRRKAAIVCERDLLGTSPNGSLWMFNVLRLHAFMLLRFVQNMCMRNKELCCHASRAVSELMHIEPDNTQPEDRHVDGDILARLIEHPDAEGLLDQMLDTEPQNAQSSGRAVDFASAAQRRARFVELLEEMIAEDVTRDSRFVENNPTATAKVIEIVRAAVESPY